MIRFLTPTRRSALRSLAESFVPEIAQASPEEWDRIEATFERTLERRPPELRRQLAVFLGILRLASRLRHGRSLTRLDAARRTALLESLSRSPILLLRRGIWGLRTLIMMGWYTQPEVIQAIGYRADPQGWTARR